MELTIIRQILKSARLWRRVEDDVMFLGAYATPEEAARAYDAAARQRFGEFACTNEDLGLLPQHS